MQIVTSWRESVLLLWPSNFKIFFLISLRALGIAIKTMIIYWWPLLITFWAQSILSKTYNISIHALMHGLLLFILLASLRASAGQKNYSYFGMIFLKGWIPLLVAILYFIIGLSIQPFSILGQFLFYFGWTIGILYPLIFFILFVTDSDGLSSSLLLSAQRALTMWIYNMPWLCAIAGSCALGEWILFFLGTTFAHSLGSVVLITSHILLALLYGLEISLLTNFYIKRLHEQLEHYYILP
jgi:hypothetical protein